MLALTTDVPDIYNDDLAYAGPTGLAELTSDEIDNVAGGPLPVLAVLAIKAVVYTGVGAAGAAAGVGLVLAVKEVVT